MMMFIVIEFLQKRLEIEMRHTVSFNRICQSMIEIMWRSERPMETMLPSRYIASICFL